MVVVNTPGGPQSKPTLPSPFKPSTPTFAGTNVPITGGGNPNTYQSIPSGSHAGGGSGGGPSYGPSTQTGQSTITTPKVDTSSTQARLEPIQAKVEANIAKGVDMFSGIPFSEVGFYQGVIGNPNISYNPSTGNYSTKQRMNVSPAVASKLEKARLTPESGVNIVKDIQPITQSTSQEYISKQQIGTFRDENSGQKIPTYKYIITDQSGKYIRDANSYEVSIYQNQPKQLVALTKEQQVSLPLLQKASTFISTKSSNVDSPVYGLASSAIGTATFIKSIVTEPILTIKSIPEGLYQSYKKITSGDVATLIYEKPGYVGGYIVGEYFTGKAIGSIVEKTTEISKVATTRLSPDYRAVLVEGDTQVIKNIPSSVSKTGKIDINIAKGLNEIKVPLSEQVDIAGKTITAVSAQRSLFGMIDRNIDINKPIPGQESLSKSTISQIDNIASLKPSELLKLNIKIKEESGSKGLLEKSFFADPYSQLRISRLGILEQPEQASILDIFSGDVSFKKTKPQAIIFENQEVEKLSRDIYYNLKSGKSLNVRQQSELLKQQITPSGKFKPIGFISQEPEVTLAPGEVIIKQKTIGRTLLNGKSIVLIRAGVKQASSDTKLILSKSSLSSLSKSDIKLLESETGFSSSQLIEKPYLSPYKIGLEVSRAYKQPASYKSYYGKLLSTSVDYSNISKSPNYKSTSVSKYDLGYSISPKVSVSSITPRYDLSISPTTSKINYRYNISYNYKEPSYGGYYRQTKKKKPLSDYGLLEQKKYNKKRSSLAFDLFEIKNKRPTLIRTGLTRQSALDLGTRDVLSDLKATFFIKQGKGEGIDIGTTGEFQRAISEGLFRRPTRGSRLNKLGGEVFIQKQSKTAYAQGRLTSRGERTEIQSRKRAKMEKYLK